VQQLVAMDSVPAYAAINQTVELVKRRHGVGASKLANAVLRRVERERAGRRSGRAPPSPPTRSSAGAAHSHPAWLVGALGGPLRPEASRAAAGENDAEAPVVARPYGVDGRGAGGRAEAAGCAPRRAAGGRWPAGSLRSAAAWRSPSSARSAGAASTCRTRRRRWSRSYAAFPPGATVADLCAAPAARRSSWRARRGWCWRRPLAVALRRVAENVRRLGAANLHPFVGDATRAGGGAVDAVLSTRRAPDRDLPPAPRRAVAAEAVGPRRAAGAAARHPARRRDGGAPRAGCSSTRPARSSPRRTTRRWTTSSPRTPRLDARAARRPARWPEALLDGGRLRVLPHRHSSPTRRWTAPSPRGPPPRELSAWRSRRPAPPVPRARPRTTSGGGWRSGARRALPWLITAGAGFLLGYLVVYLLILPGAVIPTDRPVPDVRGLLVEDAERALRDAGFAPRLGERRVNATAVPNTVTAQQPPAPTRKPKARWWCTTWRSTRDGAPRSTRTR
jgi:16S rRNA (cytosine967-C5)-methyltransferase